MGVCIDEGFWADDDRSIPAITREVYDAFDAGEFRHENDPTDIDPELKYTKPLIKEFLKTHRSDK